MARAGVGVAASLVARPPREVPGTVVSYVGSMATMAGYKLRPRSMRPSSRVRMRRFGPSDAARLRQMHQRGTLPRNFMLEIPHDGHTYRTMVHVPRKLGQGRPARALLNLHGFTSNAGEQADYTQMNHAAGDEGFVVLHPEGRADAFGVRSWNAAPLDGGECCGESYARQVDDVGFMRQLLDTMEEVFDVKSVASTGISNGGMLSWRLLHEMSDRIKAIAPQVGHDLMPGALPAGKFSVLEINGRYDPLVPARETTMRVASAVGGLRWPRTGMAGVMRVARQNAGGKLPRARESRVLGAKVQTWESPEGFRSAYMLHDGGHVTLGDGKVMGLADRAKLLAGSRYIARWLREELEKHEAHAQGPSER